MKTLLVSLFMLYASFGYALDISSLNDKPNSNGDVPMVKHYTVHDSAGNTYRADYDPFAKRTTIYTADFGYHGHPARLNTYIEESN